MSNTRWEYMTVLMGAGGFLSGGGRFDPQELTDKLNGLGDEGWELVSIFHTNRASGETRVVGAVLKRPR